MEKSTLVVSDLHLTPEFNKRKFDYLRRLFQKADRLIVNGDLWSYFYCDFADFLASGWRKLFPIMLEKECVYVHGNHDRKRWCDENTRLFSIATYDRYSFEQNGKTFNVQHGDLINHKPIKSEKFYKYLNKHQTDKYVSAIQKTILKSLGSEFYNRIGARYNKKHKKYTRKFVPQGEILLCGHTHSPEKSVEKRYINTGFIDYGISSYLLIDDKVSLVRERY